LFAYNILSSINDSNLLCPWKGCVHVYWTWTAKSFISKSSILCSWSLPRLSFLLPENGSRVSTYVCLGVDFDKGEFHGYWKAWGLALLGNEVRIGMHWTLKQGKWHEGPFLPLLIDWWLLAASSTNHRCQSVMPLSAYCI